MTDRLHRYEYLPVAGLVAAQGLYVWQWYVAALMPPQAAASMPWLAVAAGIAAVVAIDGALVATIIGVRSGRRSRWSYATIAFAVLFGALVALDLHGVLPFGAWLHAGYAMLSGAYLMHLAQPSASTAQMIADLRADLAETTRDLATARAALAAERERPVLSVDRAAAILIDAGAPEATIRTWRTSGRLREL